MTLNISPLLRTDSYKLSHVHLMDQTVGGKGIITKLLSNMTARGSRVEGVSHTVFFGLQAWLRELEIDFQTNFFDRPEEEVIEEYRDGIDGFVDLNGFDDTHIRKLHALGYLPLEVKALPEGTLVPMRVPTLTIENTHEDFAWLVNYLETWLSSALWHPTTNATTAHTARRMLDKHAMETTGQTESVDFQFHDFSFRGLSNWQSAASLGAAQLTSFKGSDNVVAKAFVKKFYPGEDNGLIAASVTATEHSIMVLNGREGELETYRRLIKANPNGILSLVSDTYDLWNVMTNFFPALKEEIMGRNGTLVIRPDSGNPADIICGTNPVAQWVSSGEPSELSYVYGQPESKGVIELLWEIFGGTINEQGFKVLDPHVGAIYGDSINIQNADEIITRLRDKGFASTNIVFGWGSFLAAGAVAPGALVTRDTYGHAIKGTWAEVNGTGVNLLKDPITDSGLKKSATGRLAVLNQMNGELVLVEKATPEQEAISALKTVWKDGMFVRTQSFQNIRETLKRSTAILERAGALV